MTQFVHYIPHEADDKLNVYQMRLYGHYIRIKSTDEPLAIPFFMEVPLY